MSDTVQARHNGSTDRFGYEWHSYHAVLAAYEEQFNRWLPMFSRSDWAGKRFLDVGCGMGRNSFWPMTYGAQSGVAVDLDPRSLAAARRNLANHTRLQVIEASAYELPFENEFDIAFSIGVIHHLEFPSRALTAMTRATKPGGRVAIWVYGRENNGWFIHVLNPMRRALFARLPIGLTHHLSVYPTALLWLALRLGIQPLTYFKLIATFNFHHLRSIVFDQMLPHIANYWRQDEVEALMHAAGMTEIRLDWVNEMSWAAVGTKPQSG